jgi:D-3-phosphoglycerate dehydrogenase
MTLPDLIIATGPVTQIAHDMLSEFGNLVELPDHREGVPFELIPQMRAIVLRGGSTLDRELINAADRLEVIGRSGVGTDGVDLEAASANRIPVVITPNAGVSAVAEGTFTMFLSITKRIRELDVAVRDGFWSQRDTLSLGDLEGATLGIMGLGRIGRRVASIGSAFGMNVSAFDPYMEERAMEKLGIRHCNLTELFETADFISLHAPLTPKTKDIVNAELLSRCKPGAILVNLARGGLIDSYESIHAALDSGQLAGVGLDVFESEPPDTSHPIFRDSRVLFSPHALGLTNRARERIFQDMAAGMVDVLSGRRPTSIANPEIYEEASE